MKRKIDPYERSNHSVLLKQFNFVPVNKQVTGHKEEGKNLWTIYFEGNWHTVPADDIEIQKKGDDIL